MSEAGLYSARVTVSRRVLLALRARRLLWRFLSHCAREAASRGGATWLVGGLVRDLVEKKPGNDVDLLVTGIGFEELGSALRALPALPLGIKRIAPAGKQFPVYRVKVTWAKDGINVTTARTRGKCSGDIAAAPPGPDAHWAAARADASLRDLTINSLMVRLRLDRGRLTGEVVDFFGGLIDLRRRLLRGIENPAARMAEDPLRALRAIRQKNERPGYRIDAQTWSAICRVAREKLRAMPGDRIAAELRRALSANPVGTLDDLARSGILAVLIPEWKRLPRGAVGRAKRRIAFLRRSFRAPLSPTLLFAALLADLAGTECRKRSVEETRPPHAAGGGRQLKGGEGFVRLSVTKAIATRLHLPGVRRITRMLEDLVRLARIEQLPNPAARIEAIFRRWEDPRELLALYRAAQKAAGRRPRDFRATLRLAASRPPLLSGRDLAALGMPPGPAIERVLAAVRDATITGRVRRKRDAFALARRIAGRFQLLPPTAAIRFSGDAQ